MATSYPNSAAYSVRRRVSIADSIPVPAISTLWLAADSRAVFSTCTLLFLRKQNRFSGRPEHDDARHRRTRIAFDVGFELLVVDVAVGIERRRDGGKDSGKKHQSSS